MATPQSKLKTALSPLVGGNVWADMCPKATPPKEYIVYHVLNEYPADHGDDVDLAWEYLIAVQYVHTGNVNYIEKKNSLRSLLREAGFSFINITAGYDSEAKATKVILNVSITEEGE